MGVRRGPWLRRETASPCQLGEALQFELMVAAFLSSESMADVTIFVVVKHNIIAQEVLLGW